MKRAAVPWTVAVLGAAIVALLVFGLTSKSTSHSIDADVAHGVFPAVPVAALPALDRPGSGSLRSYRGEVVVLNFWASWCVPCQTEAPLLQRAQPDLLAHHATVLGVTYDDATDDSQSFIRKYGLSYPQLRDVTGSYAHRFGTDQLPESFVIDRQGRIRAISRGEVGGAFLAAAISLAKAS